MDDEILCYVYMFALEQTVKLVDKEVSVPTYKLGTVLPSLCESEHYDTIHLYGNEKYIDGIVQEIYENKNYSNIMVKVN